MVEPDGTVRQVLVTDVDEAERVAWHWWADDGPLTSVEITLTPIPTGTRVDVTEIYARIPGGADRRDIVGGPHPWPTPVAPRSSRESRFETSTSALQPAVDWIEATDTARSRRLDHLGREVVRRRSATR